MRYADGGIFAGLAQISVDGRCLYIANTSGFSDRGLNVYEQLYSTLCSVQAWKIKDRSKVKVVLIPRSSDMFYTPVKKMKKLFYKGALIASLEFTLHSQKRLATARMSCCKCTAAMVLLELPALEVDIKYCTFMQRFGVKVTHVMVHKTKNPMCCCGPFSVDWETLV